MAGPALTRPVVTRNVGPVFRRTVIEALGCRQAVIAALGCRQAVVSGFSRTLLASMIALSPSTAAADWMIAGFVGAAKTPATTLKVTPDSGAAFELADVAFRGAAWRSPIYYGYRLGWLRNDARLSYEAEFIHAKTIAVDTRSTLLTAFEQSHGLNFAFGNLAVRSRTFCDGRCTAIGRAGLGISIPHVEATYAGAAVSEYQFGGPAVQAGAGLEIVLHRGFTAIVDTRVTRTSVTDSLPGAVLKGSFTSWHTSVGAGWRFR
jgi:hypothetical protein